MTSVARDYESRARQFMPSEPTVLNAEIRRLHADGLTPRDLSAALGVNLDTVLDALLRSDYPQGDLP